MTKQEAAALLRRAAENDVVAAASVRINLPAIADLLDPPRNGMVEVTVMIGWSRAGEWEERGFGPKHLGKRTQKDAFGTLVDYDCALSPTIITAWVPAPSRTVAQVEGETEG